MHQIALFARLMSSGLRAAIAVLALFDRLRALRVEPGISPRPSGCIVEMKKARRRRAFHFYGGADGIRTRDPRRDRPVF